MFFLYRFGIQFYILAVKLAAIFNTKARKSIQGRKLTQQQINPFPDHSYIWFHCASLGEFEQGRPLIELIKSKHPNQKILLTFYSPSGYEIRKDYHCADVVVYLPFDTRVNAEDFINKYRISLAVFVKYEIWPNFFKAIQQREIPIYLISAVFHNTHWYFKWYGRFVKRLLSGVKTIFVQDPESLKILSNHGISGGVLSGDARVDRVIQLKEGVQPIEKVEQFLNGQRVIVFGSIYHSDMDVLNAAIQSLPSDVKFILAPHEVHPKMIEFLQSVLKNVVLWSSAHWDIQSKILIIDNIGNLNKVYQYASVVYIGGGFDKGIHNILEPAVFNIPVCFGPRHEKFHEAKSLINAGLAFSHDEPARISENMVNILKNNMKQLLQEDSQRWFDHHSGATELIYSRLAASI